MHKQKLPYHYIDIHYQQVIYHIVYRMIYRIVYCISNTQSMAMYSDEIFMMVQGQLQQKKQIACHGT